MIDQNVHLEWFAVLAERFGRSFTPTLHDAYLIALDPHLTTEEFVRGCQTVFWGDTFWPTPARIVDAALGSLEERGIAQWSLLWETVTRDQSGEIDSVTRAVLRDMGGFIAIQSSLGNGGNLMRVREKFIGEYTLKASAVRTGALTLPAPRASSEANQPVVPAVDYVAELRREVEALDAQN